MPENAPCPLSPPASAAARATAIVVAMALLAGCQTVDGFLEKMTASEPTVAAPVATTTVPTPDAADQAVTLDKAGAKRLQARLAKLGFDPGPIDGIVGARTVKAIEQYQSAHHLPVTGAITQPFLTHVDAAAAPVPPAKRPGPINLSRDDLPAYQPGTTFIYSNGVVARVASSDAAAVQWVRRDGTKYTAPQNFLLPWSYWTSSAERGKAAVTEAVGALWPLREGAEVTYAASFVVQRKADSDATEERVDHWRCRNDGERTVTVPAGTFDTVVFVCRRGADPDAPDLVRTWYYAKDVRHYVRYVEQNPARDTTATAELIAVRPGAPAWPPIVRAALARAIVHTLETRDGDSQMPWTSSAVNTTVTIEAGARFVRYDGTACRRFVQVWSDAAGQRHYPALACQIDPEHWAIPGLKASADASLEPAGDVS